MAVLKIILLNFLILIFWQNYRDDTIRSRKNPEGNAEKGENRNKSHRQKRWIMLTLILLTWRIW